MGNFIARHRRNRAIAWLARRSQRFLDRYHNLDYDPLRNGERFVIEQLAASGVLFEHPVFDVGANIGGWTGMVKSVAPAAQIHAFEIVPSTFATLSQRVGAMPGLVINDFGLGATEGRVTVCHFPGRSGVSSILSASGGGKHPFVEIECSIRRGDDYLAKHGISRLSMLKIDVEGSEPDVLRGFQQALGEQRVDVVQFEYGKINVARRFLLADFFALFEGCGYRVGKIYPGYVDFRDYRAEDEDFRGPNYLAVDADRSDLISLLA